MARFGRGQRIEGLRQKGWTLCSLGLILHVAKTLNGRGVVTGQGDNQNMKVWIPLPDGVTTAEASGGCSGCTGPASE